MYGGHFIFDFLVLIFMRINLFWQVIRALLKDELLPNLKIQEVFLVNVDELVDNFSKLVDAGQKPNLENLDDPDLKIIQDPTYRRFKSTVDLNLAVKMHFWEK